MGIQIIREIPVGVNQAGELVCIPNLQDPPSIGILGGKGNGKTLMMAGIFERMYWYWKYLGMFLNDYNGECYAYSEPLNISTKFTELYNFKDKLKVTHEKPTGLPIITCIPDDSYFESFNINICRPYREFLENPGRFVELDKSGKYVMAEVDQLSVLKKWSDIEAFLIEMAGRKEDMGKRLVADFKWIYNHKIFDVSSEGVSTVRVGDYELDVLPALMLKRMVPALYTGKLSTKHFFSNYIAYVLDDLYQLQIERDSVYYKNGIFICLCIDELKKLCNINAPTLAEQKLNECMAQGRMARIAIIWATQNISQVNATIAGNSNFIFSYAINDEKDIKLIRANYGLPLSLSKEIPLLDKFECIAMTREHFVVYNYKGERRETKEPMKIIALPPLSEHKTPKGNKT